MPIPGKTRHASYILTINKQTIKLQIKKTLSISLTHSTMRTDSTKCPSWATTQAETAMPPTDGCNDNRMSSCLHSTKSLFQFCKTSSGCVRSRLRNKSSKFYKISSVLYKIACMLKILGLLFVDTVYILKKTKIRSIIASVVEMTLQHHNKCQSFMFICTICQI